jgi:hypothetical protein
MAGAGINGRWPLTGVVAHKLGIAVLTPILPGRFDALGSFEIPTLKTVIRTGEDVVCVYQIIAFVAGGWVCPGSLGCLFPLGAVRLDLPPILGVDVCVGHLMSDCILPVRLDIVLEQATSNTDAILFTLFLTVTVRNYLTLAEFPLKCSCYVDLKPVAGEVLETSSIKRGGDFLGYPRSVLAHL